MNTAAFPHQRQQDETDMSLNLDFNADNEAPLTAEELQARYQALQEKLRQAHRMEIVGRLVGGVIHDFNNLLTVLLGYSEFVADGLPPDHALAEPLHEIQRTTVRAAALTQRLLTLGRAQPAQRKPLHLNQVLSDMDKLLRRVITENISLDLSLQPGLEWVSADIGQIEQVVMNLVLNARDAMPRGGRLVVETSSPLAPSGRGVGGEGIRYVLLTVADTGCGMDAETEARVFDPFFTTKEPGKGTGLGLATVADIVHDHEGYISLSTAPGKGTTFKIYLPCHPAPEARPKSAPAILLPMQGSETILIVDDDEGIRNLVRHVLRQSGYRVLSARNGLEALQLCRQEPAPIHLLLADLVMPHMSGQQLAAHVQQVRPAMKVLFLSGYSEETLAAAGTVAADRAFLAKPFTPSGLVEKVREVLEG